VLPLEYITETNDMYYDEIKNRIYTDKGKILSDYDVNDLYIGASTIFDGDFNVQKSDIQSILTSSIIRTYNPLHEFFNVDIDAVETGYINRYAKLLPYNTEQELNYNIWALSKWLVGAVHNWTCSNYDMEVCPFVLVLTGEQGNGKSSFIRNILPKALNDNYFLEERIDGTNKDSKIKMGQYLLLCDEEFGGMATKDVKAFKSLADLRVIDERQAYRANSESWKRRAILAGTTNETSILKDVTGNRRILPINTWLGKIDYDGVIAFDTTKLLLEAYKMYKTGYDWRIYSKDEQKYLNDINEDFEESEPFGDIFFNTFSHEKVGDFKRAAHKNTGEIMDWFGLNSTLKINKHNVEDMMQKHGNIKKTPVKINGKVIKAYRLYERDLLET